MKQPMILYVGKISADTVSSDAQVFGGQLSPDRDKHAGSPERQIFGTIRDALKASESEPETPCEIRISPGVYEEQLNITRSFLTLAGSGEGEVRITGSLGALTILEDGKKRGTFRTQTVFLHAHDVTLRDLTIENTAGPGKTAGQAVALYADGDRLLFERVTLTGWQDTLFCGPLPPKEIEPGGFRGPLEHAPRINGRQYYRSCRISGNIDFIFGSATAFFEHCEIEVREPGSLPQGAYITASSTAQGQKYGLVFSRCRITHTGLPGRIYLGRPWREYARAVFLRCELDAQVAREGWEDWGKPHEELFLAEYQSCGAGARVRERAAFSRQLTDQEAGEYAREEVLGPEIWWDEYHCAGDE